ncbi:glycosyltransferase involved in cell wall biosynthesis [Rahnella inusitata]|nr:glycosyltransferase involved in cell wall biosynthesis [Rahnella inusitata]
MNPLISICIPTKDRLKHLTATVDSIINDDVDVSLYEIVISDNSDNDKIKVYCENLQAKGYRVKHVKNPLLGFYNSIVSLREASGSLLKLHNDYSCFVKGQFAFMVNYVQENLNDMPTIFFSNGTLGFNEDQPCNSKDAFFARTHFQNTWSSAFSIWKKDFDLVPHEREDLDSMFPHTSILLNCIKENYLICDQVIFENISVSGKGGYNLFECFCDRYLNMLRAKVKSSELTNKTFRKIKWKMFLEFITPWYFKTVYTNQGFTYDITNADNIIKSNYGILPFYGMLTVCLLKKILSRR